jgi:medium-chain acyl-[acyl-carrier-protein] hydrolase
VSRTVIRFPRSGHSPPAALLICFPHAGAGISAFRQWARNSAHIAVAGVRLPGRESRLAEPLLVSMPDIVAAVLPELLPAELPVVLYGHCAGAVVGYDVATALTMAGQPPLRLVVSSSTTPYRTGFNPRLSGLPAEEFAAAVAALGSPLPAATWELAAPAVRADLRALEERPPFDVPLPGPVAAFRGAEDHIVSAPELAEWADYTLSDFTATELPAGHHLMATAGDRLLAEITQLVEKDLGGVLR